MAFQQYATVFPTEAKFGVLKNFLELVNASATDAIDNIVNIVDRQMLERMVMTTHDHTHPPVLVGEPELMLRAGSG